LFPNKAPKG
jgi:hypothetical protein